MFRNTYASVVTHGEPPMERYNLTPAAMANLKTFFVVQGKGEEVVYATYDGTDAITLSSYYGLPVGSLIIDLQALKIHLKQTANSFVSTAALTSGDG